MGLKSSQCGPIMAIWAMTKIVGKSGGAPGFGQWGSSLNLNILMTVVPMTLAFLQAVIQQLTDKLNAVTREPDSTELAWPIMLRTYQDAKFEATTRSGPDSTSSLSTSWPSSTLLMFGICLTLAIY